MTTPPQGADPDVDLILDVALGDTAALAALVRRQVPKILGRLKTTYGMFDEELAFEACRRGVTRLYEIAEDYDESEGNLEAWFFMIAWNQARTLMKERKRHADHHNPVPVDELPEAEMPAASAQALAPSDEELERTRPVNPG